MRIDINPDMTIYRGDCLDIMPRLAAQGVKVDMVLTDPPYGTTHCRWDSIIPFVPMWECVRSVSYDTAPTLLFCQQPFTSTLGCSNLKELRYSWVWEKTQPTGFLNAKRMPMKAHEDILVFYRRLPKYNPVKTDGHRRVVSTAYQKSVCKTGDIYRNYSDFKDYDSTERYPRSVIQLKSDKQLTSLHPTQKPVPLLEYLIVTYTDPGDTVLDFAMGSASTAIACARTGRRFLGVEIDRHYFEVSENRIRKYLSEHGKGNME